MLVPSIAISNSSDTPCDSPLCTGHRVTAMTTSSVQAWTFGSGTAQAVSTDDLGRFSTGE